MKIVAEDVTAPASRGVPPKVIELAWKFAKILGVSVLPAFAVRNNLSSKWLGRCHKGGPGFRQPRNLIELQKKIFYDETTLSRIVAHEMCHHADFLLMDRTDFALARIGAWESHGPRWRAFADKVNQTMGADFVTVTSDSSVVLAPKTRPYLMMLAWKGARLGYAISPWPAAGVDRLGAKAIRVMMRGAAYGLLPGRKEFRFIRLDEGSWVRGRIPSIGSNKIIFPTDPKEAEDLVGLYERASSLGELFPELA